MESGGYRQLPVVAENRMPIGVLTVGDIVRYLVDYFPCKDQDLSSSAQRQFARDRA